MNEKRIEQILGIEKQAQEIIDAATREAEQLPAKAEQEAQKLIEKSRASAQAEARQLLNKAKAEDDAAGIVSKAEEKNRAVEKSAMTNLDKAVAYVLERVIGKE
jgi:vacuolar-type H+-ATPase subunit H